jgi:hypothetical protein
MRTAPTVTFPTSGAIDGLFVTGSRTSTTAPVIWTTTSKSFSFRSDDYSTLTANDFLRWNGNTIQLGAEL